MNHSQILEAADAVLAQGRDLLEILDDSTYSQRSGVVMDSSIGGHYRHCLEHFDCLLTGAGVGRGDFDARQRDVEVETVRKAAADRTEALRRRLPELAGRMGSPLEVQSMVSYADGDSEPVASTVARELVFCVSHAIHHYALIRVLCGVHMVEVPAGFGVAPSTVKHQQAVAGAAS